MEGNRRTFLCGHKPFGGLDLKAQAATKFSLFSSWGPCPDVKEFPPNTSGEQRITITFREDNRKPEEDTYSIPYFRFVLDRTRKWQANDQNLFIWQGRDAETR